MLIIDGYKVDCEVSSEPAYDCEVTSHPVELGSDTTDNVRVLPGTLVIEGIVTDTPIREFVGFRGDVDSNGQLGYKPSNDAFAFLLDVRARREPVTVVTGARTYTNMVLRSLTAPDNVQTGKALRFTATFVEMTFVTNGRAVVRVAAPQHQKKTNRGNKAAEPSTTPKKLTDPGNNNSWLQNIVESVTKA